MFGADLVCVYRETAISVYGIYRKCPGLLCLQGPRQTSPIFWPPAPLALPSFLHRSCLSAPRMGMHRQDPSAGAFGGHSGVKEKGWYCHRRRRVKQSVLTSTSHDVSNM